MSDEARFQKDMSKPPYKNPSIDEKDDKPMTLEEFN